MRKVFEAILDCDGQFNLCFDFVEALQNLVTVALRFSVPAPSNGYPLGQRISLGTDLLTEFP